MADIVESLMRARDADNDLIDRLEAKREATLALANAWDSRADNLVLGDPRVEVWRRAAGELRDIARGSATPTDGGTDARRANRGLFDLRARSRPGALREVPLMAEPHVHDWRGALPHEFQHCCSDSWNNRRTCICGLSEGNAKAHVQRASVPGPETTQEPADG